MKKAFFNLRESKRLRIINSCVEEFSKYGYEQSSTDRIVKRAGISKGGLYEYISHKEELFLFIVEYVYTKLYKFIDKVISSENKQLPPDILQRFRFVASVAIEFYIQNPEMILFIVKCNQIPHPDIGDKVHAIFLNHFEKLFTNIETDYLAYSFESMLDILRWFLMKTRNDFVCNLSTDQNMDQLREVYLNEWDTILSMLKNGIYKSGALQGD
ncbi:TetR/AcrR family transcriptional regulator [Chitinispirillales bacterium ANBcel5]|uniref:TetR/AcrR family transcriptional regulator n=1 Tax=Cellulosispirillum alkaliphilum TaxID=3039283 RepID=UPI002A57AA44|nr:TetR/AcrR family transcriptional regulator [Chitinispirillales bacterium ANBcel5]